MYNFEICSDLHTYNGCFLQKTRYISLRKNAITTHRMVKKIWFFVAHVGKFLLLAHLIGHSLFYNVFYCHTYLDSNIKILYEYNFLTSVIYIVMPFFVFFIHTFLSRYFVSYIFHKRDASANWMVFKVL